MVAKILGHVVDQARAHHANRETQLTFGEAVMWLAVPNCGLPSLSRASGTTRRSPCKSNNLPCSAAVALSRTERFTRESSQVPNPPRPSHLQLHEDVGALVVHWADLVRWYMSEADRLVEADSRSQAAVADEEQRRRPQLTSTFEGRSKELPPDALSSLGSVYRHL